MSRGFAMSHGWVSCRGFARAGLLSFTAVALIAGAGRANAETIFGALARAYVFSPDLGQQRAATRAIDENLPRALAGYRPTVTAQGTLGRQYLDTNPAAGTASASASGIKVAGPNSNNYGYTTPHGATLSVSQTIYNGDRTSNSVRQSESQILQSREQLRLSEETILLNAATAYMNVLRDTALLNLQNNNVEVLQQQLKQTQDQFQVGQVTRTDIAQAQSSLAQGQANAFTAQSNLQTSVANYRQLVGVQPTALAAAAPVEKLLPRSLQEASQLAQANHPQIQAALHNADAAELAVRVAEGALYPTLGVTGSVGKQYDSNSVQNQNSFTASVLGTLTVPLYQGGSEYAAVRQAKEQYGQARLQADLARETIRAQVVSAWGNFQNTKAVIQADQAAVRSAEIALNGVREEARVGQRTTLDVLNAQQVLLNARVALVSAQRDQVVNSYAVLSAVGALSAQTLGLRVAQYDPTTHFTQVKDKWVGLRTPDGR